MRLNDYCLSLRVFRYGITTAVMMSMDKPISQTDIYRLNPRAMALWNRGNMITFIGHTRHSWFAYMNKIYYFVDFSDVRPQLLEIMDHCYGNTE